MDRRNVKFKFFRVFCDVRFCYKVFCLQKLKKVYIVIGVNRIKKLMKIFCEDEK